MTWYPQPVGVVGGAVASAATVATPTTLTPPLPTAYISTATNPSDVILCFTACRSATPTVATPSGWTSLVNQSVTNGRVALFARVANAAETAPSVVWSGLSTGANGTPCMAQCMAFRGLNMTLVGLVDAVGAVNTATSQTSAAAGGAITNAQKSDMFLSLSVRQAADGAFTLLPPLENIWWHEFTTQTATTSGADMTIDWDWGYRGGPTGTIAAKTKTVTGAATSVASGGLMVALKPAIPVAGTQALFRVAPSSGSPWNEPLPASPPVASDAATQLASIEAVRSSTASGRGFNIDSGNYNVPTYNVPGGVTRSVMTLMTAANVNIAETQDQFGTSRQRLAWRLAQGIPLTDDMRSAMGTDAHMTVVDTGTGETWDLFTVWRDGGEIPWSSANWNDPTWRNTHWGTGAWRTWYGGYIANHAANIGQFNDENTPAYQSSSWGATATSLPGSAGEILLPELLAGQIPHALQLLLPNAVNGHVWPAWRDDGIPPGDTQYTQLVAAGMTPAMKEGARLRLKPSVSTTVTTGFGAHFDTTAKIVLDAMQTYGMVVNDRVNYLGGLQLRAEPGCYEWFAPGGGAPNYGAPFADAFLRSFVPAFTTANWDVIDPVFRPTGAVIQSLSGVTDNFNDNSIDATKWVVATGVTETGAAMNLACGSVYSHLTSGAGNTLRGSYALHRTTQRPVGNAADQSGFSVVNGVNANSKVTFYVSNTTLSATYTTPAPAEVSVRTLTYDATAHAWMRVSEAGGIVSFDTSPDGITWTSFTSFTWTVSGWPLENLDNVAQSWFAGNFNGVVGRPDFIIDDVNLAGVVGQPVSGSIAAQSAVAGTLSAASTVVVSDTFTGAATTILQSHTGEIGATWAAHPNSLGNAQLTAGGRLRSSAASQIALYYASGTPSAECTVDIDAFFQTSNANLLSGFTARMDTVAQTFYLVRYSGVALAWQLYRVVANTFTLLDSFAQTLSNGTTYHLKFQVTNAAKTVLIDGVQRMTSVDNTITTAGRVGFRLFDGGTINDSNGLHYDNLSVVGSTTPTVATLDLEVFGHSYSNGYGLASPTTERATSRVAAALGYVENNQGVTSSEIQKNGVAQGGYARVYNTMTPLADFVDVGIVWFGINDTGTFFQYTGGRELVKHGIRAAISRFRCGGHIYEDTSPTVTLGSGWSSQTAGTDYSSSTTSQQRSTTGTNVLTVAVPADFGGGTVVFGMLNFGTGGAVWEFSVDGGAAQTLDTQQLTTEGTWSHCFVRRLTGLAAGAHTITMTVSAIVGTVYFDWWGWEDPNLAKVVVVNQPTLPGTLDDPVRDQRITDLNTDIAAAVTEFDSRVVLADITILNKRVDYFQSDDLHPNSAGHAVIADVLRAAISATMFSVIRAQSAFTGTLAVSYPLAGPVTALSFLPLVELGVYRGIGGTIAAQTSVTGALDNTAPGAKALVGQAAATSVFTGALSMVSIISGVRTLGSITVVPGSVVVPPVTVTMTALVHNRALGATVVFVPTVPPVALTLRVPALSRVP